jgi:hypothetical protein
LRKIADNWVIGCFKVVVLLICGATEVDFGFVANRGRRVKKELSGLRVGKPSREKLFLRRVMTTVAKGLTFASLGAYYLPKIPSHDLVLGGSSLVT